MIPSHKPVVSVCAVRTGAGKSPVVRAIARLLRKEGLRVAVIRHPMPYGDLSKQAVQRFETFEDLRSADCTIEEMEEYAPHLHEGVVVHAGADYEPIVRQAERDADIILWDGGNNDVPFVEADLEIVLVDPHRAGHELTFFPGEANLLRADVVVLTKLDTASPQQIDAVRTSVRTVNPYAVLIESSMPVIIDRPELLHDARVLVIEDGPTVTHGGMPYGAGVLAARRAGARDLVDPRPYAVGSIANTFARYPHLEHVLPSMGYGAEQIDELSKTIRRTPCDAVVIATPVDLRRVITIAQPSCRVTYEFEERGGPSLREILHPMIARARAARPDRSGD